MSDTHSTPNPPVPTADKSRNTAGPQSTSVGAADTRLQNGQQVQAVTAGNPVTMPKRRKGEALKSMLPRRSPRLVAGLIIVGFVVLIAVFLPLFTSNPNTISGIGLTPPSAQHWLGTTATGQDVLAQLGWSTRGSLTIGVAVGLITLVVSAVMGIVGTYIGHWTDELFSLVTNVFLVLPGMPLTIVMVSISPYKGMGLIIGVISFTAWAGASRSLRAMTLSLRGRDYVLAARIAGERPWRVVVVEMLPNLLPVMATQLTFSVVIAILSESGLAFLGLGAPGSFSLGTMLFWSQSSDALNLGAWWWFLPPGLMIALVGAGMSFINFAFDEVINPRLRTVPVMKKAKKPKAVKARPTAQTAVAVAGKVA